MARRQPIAEFQTARRYPVVLLVSSVDRRIVPAVRFVSRLPFAEPRALHVSVDPAETGRLVEEWMRLSLSWLPLHIREAPDGDVAAAVRAVLAEEEGDDSADTVTIVLPELNLPRWWHAFLHRQNARHIAAELQDVPGVTPVIVPFALHMIDIARSAGDSERS